MVLVVSNSRSPHYLLMLKKRFSILSECIDICFFERPQGANASPLGLRRNASPSGCGRAVDHRRLLLPCPRLCQVMGLVKDRLVDKTTHQLMIMGLSPLNRWLFDGLFWSLQVRSPPPPRAKKS